MENPYIIGSYQGASSEVLFFVVTTLHGNEPAGERAAQMVFKMLDMERQKKPDFEFHGKLVAFCANIAARQQQIRYIDTDMNRIWTTNRIDYINSTPIDRLLLAEERCAKELLDVMRAEIAAAKPKRIVLLDLHTTSSEGGIFTILPPSNAAEPIARTLFAPLITGFDEILEGTMMAYFDGAFEGVPCTALTFESGQHDSEDAVMNAVSAIINTLRAIGCVKPEDVEDKHDELLRQRAALLPKKAVIVYRHAVSISDDFKMRPGYQNFQAVKQKEVLADDRKGTIKAIDNALILMPLYQPQGNDGFFLIKPLE